MKAMPQKNLQNKSNLSYVKILLLIIAACFMNLSCEHCDDEDYTREQEENVAVQHNKTIVKK